MKEKILLKNFIIADGETEAEGDIFIDGGVISAVGTGLTKNADITLDGRGKAVVCPGLFDMHVHFRDPGFTHKEDILTGTDAAAAGGFTGVACMPNTKPATDSAETIKYIIDKANGTGVDVFPVGCITKGLSGKELCDFSELKAAGAHVISDDGRPVERDELLLEALEKSNSNGLLVACHCEDLKIIDGGIINKGEISEKLGVKGMDRASEDSITKRDVLLAQKANSRIHICHVSTKGSVDFIRQAKAAGVKVTCETCPHYFTYTDEKLLSRDADYRMNPPLRTESDRLAVLEGVLDGTIDCIVTDHAPHTAEEKKDFLTAPNGVVGLETSLAVVITKLYDTGKITLSDIVRLMSTRPRELVGAEKIKIEVGQKANLTLFNPCAEWEVIPEKLHSKSKNTVFKGEKLKGMVLATILGECFRYTETI